MDVRLDSLFRENDPPQAEWGIKGVEGGLSDSLRDSIYDGYRVQKRYDMLYSYYDDIS